MRELHGRSTVGFGALALGAAAMWWLALAMGLLVAWAWVDRRLDPTGPHDVTSQAWVLLDDRPDPFAAPPTPRRIPVEAWYPATGPSGPLVVFVHGTQGRRHAYRTWIREFASQGYTVVAADHPPVALRPDFPDGSAAPASAAWSALMGEAVEPSEFVAHETFALAHDVVADDLRAILDDVGPRLGVATDRVLLAGHSFGGGLAVTLCDDDPRCAAIIDLDGPPFADPALPTPPDVPLLVVLAGRTRQAEALDVVWRPIDRLVSAARGPTLVVTLPTAGHLDLSDLPLIVRPALLRRVFPGSQIGPDDPAAKLRAVAAVSVAFADRYLKGDRSADPEAIAEANDLVTLVRRIEPWKGSRVIR